MTRQDIVELIETIVEKYRDRLDWLIERRNEPLPEPTPEEWRALETKFGCTFPPAFVDFMAVMSAYREPGHLEVAARDDPLAGDTISHTYDRWVSSGDWPPDLIPFNGGDGDYYCLSAAAGPESPVLYVYDDVVREEGTEQIAGSFDEWLKGLETHLCGELAGVALEDVPKPAFDRKTNQRLFAASLVARQWFPKLFRK